MQKKNSFYKWELLIWLWLAYFFNQGDRQIFNIALPLIKADLELSDAQLGLVGSIFILTLGICFPIAGFVGDIFNRKKIVGYSLLFWSLATFLTGFGTSLVHLILLRSLSVGGGEAFYAPAANGLIGQFHQKSRAFAMSIHQTSLYAGVIVSGALGGYIAQTYGWKNTFFLYGGAGVVLAIILFWRLQPAVSAVSNLTWSDQKRFIKTATLALISKPSAILLCVAFLSLVIVNVGYTTWMPTFLHEKFNLSIAEAGFNSMFYHHVFAFAGVILGGILSDKAALKAKKNRLVIQSLGLLLGAPFLYGMGQAESTFMTYVALSGFGFFRGLYEANLYATLFAVIEAAYRSTSVGLSAMFAFIIASLVPFLLGYLKPTLGLSDGLSALSVSFLIGGIAILIVLRFYFQKDSQLKTEEV
ncbi:MFS transporter [Runella slithyformis]|uniref:Major facilitator superfamily MFS_1 n=1 Tax=Runella slithyformis (strain ATCC 29530 / DSM 19594 / LMG 11500 / NCIMB 11436 / LSU 4) TaxID=761193 RepID=A0A7U3ZJH7_RUNSL|nr:MFS transporter [Runella slithyformis]AEI48342.1 major facilitator superfamily MFS_1 [Runella slithyformis DSM 19594]